MNKTNFKTSASSSYVNRAHMAKDVNAKSVFKDPVMCCQFLKGYSGIDIFKDITPDNIIDETEKYQGYLGIEFEADTVKRVNLNNNKTNGIPIFLISLIEHKSKVDYNISIQLLKYMVCIWVEYGKEMQKSKVANPTNQSFMYPPIVPIVYYEGKEKWTAGMNLKDRINMSHLFSDFIPDFTYKLICNYNYSNDELLTREDELSLFMLLNKVQTAEDMSAFLRLDNSKLNAILQKSPEHTLKIIADAMWALCMKINVPQDEAVDYVGKVWDRDMGYLFENMEKLDIQEERRKVAEARQEAEDARQEAEDARQEAEDARQEAEDARQEAEDLKVALEKALREIEQLKQQRE